MTGVLSDPALYEYTGGHPPTVQELTRLYMIQTRGHSLDGSEEWINLVVTLGPEEQPIGYVQATIPTDGRPTEIAWVIGTPWQGHGYATRAARMLVAHLEQRGIHDLVAHIHPDHSASQHIAAALGLAATDTMVDGETRWQTTPAFVLPVANGLRLRRFDPDEASTDLLEVLLDIYDDPDTVRNADGPDAAPYSMDKLLRMYRHLHSIGELYLIERSSSQGWTPIGDVTLADSMIPIVIDRRARRQGVARLVLQTLIVRARELGWHQVIVSDIYDYNTPSAALFTSLGFRPTGTTSHGSSYALTM